jgi:PAS domain S-box-containing protein
MMGIMFLERSGASAEQLAQQIRVACERVDSLIQNVDTRQKSGKLSEAFEELFALLEELRTAEKELRVKNDELLSMQEIMEIERDRYQELFEVCPDAYFLTDPNSSIFEANRASSHLFGITNEKMKGLTLLLFMDEIERAELRKQLQEMHPGDVLRNIELHILPIGDRNAVHVQVTVGSVHDSQGTLAGFHWFLRDITDLKAMEKAWRLSEERFRSIAQLARDAIVITDSQGVISSWNKGAEDIFGIPEKETMGKAFIYLLPETEREKYQSLFEDSLSTGKPLESQALRKDGTVFPVEISVCAWMTGGDRYYGSIIRDISERKQAEETRIRLLERVMTAQEEDRRWIARELHDETGQSLTSLLVGLRMIEDARTLKKARLEAGRLRSITAQTLDDLGRLAKGLRPIILDDLGLVVALNRHAAEFGRSFGISIDFKIRGLESKRLPLAVETALFRIAQEALTNIARHANARNILIELTETETEIDLRLMDDGKGFNIETVTKEHLGIHGMKERAALLGGLVKIDSKHHQGTTVHVSIYKSRFPDVYGPGELRAV